jgi:hypothetical protein
MKKFQILLFGFFLVISAEAQTLLDVRQGFHEAVMEPSLTKEFHQFLNNADNTPTINAYRAASEAMMARVVWNPLSKFAQVIKYADLMEQAVNLEEENIEIRFLRLSIEYNLPKFLGMSKHLKEDTEMIVKNLSMVQTMNLDPAYGRYILSFLDMSELCNDQEILAMEQSLSLL